MSSRVDYYKIAADGIKNVMNMEDYLHNETSIDKKLAELIKIRVSQINHCAFCLNMHTTDARKLGETEQRIYLLNAWREAGIYTEKEMAALDFAEKVTLISENPITDEVYQNVRRYFDEKEYTDLLFAITQINTWNRISISMANTIS